MLRSGPPELPLLMGASVWIASVIVAWFGAVISRCSALTIPAVTVSSSPNGLPIATTSSPTWSTVESPSGIGASALVGASTWSTARSVEVSAPTSVALYFEPFGKRIEIEVAPSITCSLVTMCPLVS